MQIGTPELIYKKPGNTFVAGFIGVSNFIDCVIEGGEAKAAGLHLSGGYFLQAKLKEPYSGNGIVSARPEQLFFDEKQGLSGSIVMSTFLGDFIEYEIELDSGQTLQLNEYTKDCQTVRPDGCRVFVNFDSEAISIYRADSLEVISC